LVSDCGALPELVREGETGFVVSSFPFKRGRLGGGDSAELWREKIDWCLAHRQEIEKMKENCFKEAEKYKLENYLNRLLNYINN
jgi:glycosyltransferase involved in cell wall biosynthesis